LAGGHGRELIWIVFLGAIAYHLDAIVSHLYPAAHEENAIRLPERFGLAQGALENGDLNPALHVLQHGKGHGFTVLGGEPAHFGDHASEHHLVAGHLLIHLAAEAGEVTFQAFGDLLQRVFGQIGAE
jgi:hypothetical protein